MKHTYFIILIAFFAALMLFGAVPFWIITLKRYKKNNNEKNKEYFSVAKTLIIINGFMLVATILSYLLLSSVMSVF